MGDDPSERRNDAYLSRLIDASIHASARVRSGLLVLVVTTVLMFVFAWNNFPLAWINLMLDGYSRVAQMTDQELDEYLEEYKPGWCELSQARKSLLLPKAREAADAQVVLQRRLKTEIAEVTKLPLFGVAIHANEVPILGGFALLLVYFWLWTTLWTEQRCLENTFNEASSQEYLKRCYVVLSGWQVFSVPVLKEGPRGWKLGLHGASALFVVPVIVSAATHSLNAWTWRHGFAISKTRSIIDYTVGGFTWCVMVLLMVACLRIRSRIQKKWTAIQDEIEASPTGSPICGSEVADSPGKVASLE